MVIISDHINNSMFVAIIYWLRWAGQALQIWRRALILQFWIYPPGGCSNSKIQGNNSLYHLIQELNIAIFSNKQILETML